MTCSEDQKVTTMLLKVDLDCYQCYKKVKKTLCQFPQVRNQVFDEKNNVVIITVVCCSPEKIRDKLCRKGGKSIKGIEMKVDKPKPVSAPGPAQPDKPDKPASAEPDKKATPPEKDKKSDSKSNDSKSSSKKQDQAQGEDAAPKASAPKPAPPAKQQEPVAQWVPGYPPCPPPQMLPVAVYSASPCYGPGPGPAYGYHYGHPYQPPYYSNNNRCDYYSSEENPAACSVM